MDVSKTLGIDNEVLYQIESLNVSHKFVELFCHEYLVAFVEVVKKVQSKTEGTIAEAGLLSYAKDQAQVLVAISVKTSMAAAPPDQEPRRWRMRLTVDKNGDSAKVSKVEFVP